MRRKKFLLFWHGSCQKSIMLFDKSFRLLWATVEKKTLTFSLLRSLYLLYFYNIFSVVVLYGWIYCTIHTRDIHYSKINHITIFVLFSWTTYIFHGGTCLQTKSNGYFVRKMEKHNMHLWRFFVYYHGCFLFGMFLEEKKKSNFHPSQLWLTSFSHFLFFLL